MRSPVCSNVMTTMTAEGVTVDVCTGGCGGIWFDWFELALEDLARSRLAHSEVEFTQNAAQGELRPPTEASLGARLLFTKQA
jgi:Zn-finger nucleic acid-binding protein